MRGNLMNPIERSIRKIDRVQQNSKQLGFVFGIIKKFGDDQGGSLAGLITFFGFTSMFPLLLLVVTIFGFFAGSNSSVTHSFLHSAVAQFPVFGGQLQNNIHALHDKSPLALTTGIVGLILGSQGASQSSQYAMSQVWNIPMTQRPNYFSRLKRTGLLFLALGIFFLLGATFSTISSSISGSLIVRLLALLLSLVINLALYLSAFRILTPAQVPFKSLIWGSVIGGIAWTVLQLLGGYLISHELKHASQVYGFFAVVLGLLSWIYLGARILIYSAEINVVLTRRLWPRSIVQPPLTEADKAVLVALGKAEDRRDGEEISVSFDKSKVDKSPGNRDGK